MTGKTTWILLGSAALVGGALYAYQQVALFKDSEINILTIDRIGYSGGKLKITPTVEIINKSNVDLTVDSLEAEAFIPDPNKNWKSAARTTSPLQSVLKANSSTELSPEIEVPIIQTGALLLSSLINQLESIEVLVKITAQVNGQTLIAHENQSIEI